MSHKQQLFPWCIIRPLPNMRTQIVGRFRSRSDAEGHLQILRRLIPNASHSIIFDITPEDLDSQDLTPLPHKEMGEQNSPLSAGEGLGERLTAE